MNRRPAVLVIAGSDSSGGAGLQRDLAVLAALGAAHASAITAITAQTDDAVRSTYNVPAEIIADQIAAALEGRDIRAIKIGMLGTRATVLAVAAGLKKRRGIPIVLDPVLASSSGRALLDPEGLAAMRDLLFPMVAILTPNIPEMATLCGAGIAVNETVMIEQAEQILAQGPMAVLAKGGHSAGETAVDWLITRDSVPLGLEAQRLKYSIRGTGCALSTAIAAGLAVGKSLQESCRLAKEHVQLLLYG